MRLTILLAVMFLFQTILVSGQSLKIDITDIRNNKGNILLVFYQNNDQFQNDKSVLKRTVKKTNLKDGTLSVTYDDLKSGDWGIALLDDENNNRDMDYRFKIPTEGYGFSNYVHNSLRYPKFSDFKFQLVDNNKKEVVIKVKYIL